MDYGGGSVLQKYQWDLVHHPRLIIPWLQDEEGAALKGKITVRDGVLKGYILSDAEAYLSPSNIAIQIPGIESGAFSGDGQLIRFKLADGREYTAVYTETKFYGYADMAKLAQKGLATVGNDGALAIASDENIEKLKTCLHTGFSTVPIGAPITAYAYKSVENVTLEQCACKYQFDAAAGNIPADGAISGGIVDYPLPLNAPSLSETNCKGENCPLSIDGLLDGPGKYIYLGMIHKKDELGINEEKLKELANYITTKADGGTVAFYGYGMEDEQIPSTVINDHIINSFIKNEIVDLETFKELFSPNFETFARDAGIIFSNAELRYELPDDYNKNTIDWVKYRNEGITVNYEYSFCDLVYRAKVLGEDWSIADLPPLLKGQPLAEGDGNGGPYCTSEYSKQYYAKYQTNSAIFFWAEGYAIPMGATAIVGYAAGMLPGAATDLATLFGTEEMAKRTSQALIAAVIDAGIQASIHYYFEQEDGKESWADAFASIDKQSLAFSATDAFFDDVVVSTCLSCIEGAYGASADNASMLETLLEKGNIISENGSDFESQMIGCFENVIIDLVFEGIFSGVGHGVGKLKELIKNNPDKFISKLLRFPKSIFPSNAIKQENGKTIVSTFKETDGIDLGVVMEVSTGQVDRPAKLMAYTDSKEVGFVKLFDHFDDVEYKKVADFVGPENTAEQIGSLCDAMKRNGMDPDNLDDVIEHLSTYSKEQLEEMFGDVAIDLSNPKKTYTEIIEKHGCFAAGTQVYTPMGGIAIENIQRGDKIWSFNEKENKPALQTVTNTFTRTADTIIYLWLGKELIKTTASHPFFTPNEWKPALSLREGDQVQNFNGAFVPVGKIEVKDTSASVHNIAVLQHHSYYVGRNWLLVHNKCGLSNVTALKNLGLSDEIAKELDKVKGIENLFSRNGIKDFIGGDVFDKLPVDQKTELLKDIARSHDTFKPNIGDKIAEIDDGILEVWNTLRNNGNGSPNKRLDFEFLSSNKGKTQDDIINALTISNRTQWAEDLATTFPNCSTIIKQSLGDYASKVRKAIASPKDMEDYLNLYFKNSKDIYENGALKPNIQAILSDCKSNGRNLTENEFKAIFNNCQIHHVIPVNLISNNRKLQRILEYAQNNGFEFDFNSIDNLIPLPFVNHSGSHAAYDKYIANLIDQIDVQDMDEALEELKDIISKTKERFSNELIGSDIKINDIN